jgi:hypothetical protein
LATAGGHRDQRSPPSARVSCAQSVSSVHKRTLPRTPSQAGSELLSDLHYHTGTSVQTGSGVGIRRWFSFRVWYPSRL